MQQFPPEIDPSELPPKTPSPKVPVKEDKTFHYVVTAFAIVAVVCAIMFGF